MPTYCEIHQHAKWCEHNGGVMGATGWESPSPGLDLEEIDRALRESVRCGIGDITPIDSAREVIAYHARALLASELHNGGIRSDHVCVMAEVTIAAPALIAEVRALRAEVERLRAIDPERLNHKLGVTEDERDAARAKLAEAKRLGLDAAELSDEGWAYAGDYFTDKHERGATATIRAALEAL